MISVICPILNEKKYITQCIESILKQDYPHEDLEVLFVDGMSVDGTREIIMEYASKYPFLRLLDNPKKIVPYAMNIGIVEARGGIIIRIDAHTVYEESYFSVLAHQLQILEADNVGAVCKTEVLNKTPQALAIKEVLSNKWGVGNSLFRTGIDKVKQVDTVPFGCWKRNTFDRYGMFDVRLKRNQDLELNKRIIKGGGTIYIVPNTFCTYFARETFKELSKNNFQNGKWNIMTLYYTKMLSSLSIRHFIPLLFVLSLIIPILLFFLYIHFIYITVLVLVGYTMLLGTVCLKLSLSRNVNFVYLFMAFGILHFSYGWGEITGIYLLLSRKL